MHWTSVAKGIGIFLSLLVLVALIFAVVYCVNKITCLQNELETCQSMGRYCTDQCDEFDDQRCEWDEKLAAQQRQQQNLLGAWGLNVDATQPISTPPSPMLLSAPTVQGGTITVNAQTALNSIIPMPSNGTLTALTIELPDVLTAGAVTFAVTVNGTPSVPFTHVISYTNTSPVALVNAEVSFEAGDEIGVTCQLTDYESTAPNPTFTVQLWGHLVRTL